MRRATVVVISVLGSVFAALLVTDYLGGLPSVSKALGSCKADATSRLVGVRFSRSDPEIEDRYGYYAKHADLVIACMEAQGYQLDTRGAAAVGRSIRKEQKTQEERDFFSAVFWDEAVTSEKYWHRRWFWE